MKNREYLVFRICVAAWLFGWFFKYHYHFAPHLLQRIIAFPIVTEQFPSFFMNPYVAIIAYHLPLLCVFGFFIKRHIRTVYISIGLLLLLCTTILGLHIDTYNDMTFISSFWVAIWLAWYAYYIDDKEHIARHAPFLVKCIIALLFLGGTVGKLTPEYWSGEVFYNTVIHQTPGFFGEFISSAYSIEQQKVIIGFLSKVIIIAEGLLVLSPLFPYRFFAAFAALTIVMLVVFRSFQILSVLSCLAGITLTCLLLLHNSNAEPSSR